MKNLIKEIRAEKGISQEELAKKSGVSRSIISALENKRVSCITTKTMEAIAKALGCKTSDIFLL